MPRQLQVDLNSHLNANVLRGHPADFPVTLEPVYADGPNGWKEIPRRRAVVRTDTGRVLSIVSTNYALVPHTTILDVLERAIEPLDVGPVPRGVYVDVGGARMRALYKFPALAQPVRGTDTICPCVQVKNAYDWSSKIAIHIGAFRFVCTNLAVGGGGAFAGGFVSIHAGEIPIETMAEKLTSYLEQFDRIVALYRQWSDETISRDALEDVLVDVLHGRFEKLRGELLAETPMSVFTAYSRLTDYATHSMRSARTAFAMLERINTGFQRLSLAHG